MEPESVFTEGGFIHFDLLLPVEMHGALAERAEKHERALLTEILLTLSRSIRGSQPKSQTNELTGLDQENPRFRFPTDEELQQRITKFLNGENN